MASQASSARMLMPNGLSVADFTLVTAACNFLQSHSRRRQHPQTAGIGGRRHQPRTRHPAHPGLYHRMRDADQLGQRRAQIAHRTSLSRSDFGSITPWISFRSGSVGRPRCVGPAKAVHLEDVFSATCSGSTPGAARPPAI